ncbi:hypothetical protein [Clostridium gasigenes]|uniref:hypothetical protein n=1 Tax=Clostridium gasigenes TaxID=94869 RepID=UPI001C0D121A|nr:hypothetical protein [Clostridium gasigenes]MBU3106713.1 hypothetical protein [Clostridium gasigenes]
MQIIKTPWIDEDFKILNKYIPEIRIPQVNVRDINNRPILVNNGVAKELPLYIKAVVDKQAEVKVEDVKPIKKKKRTGRIADYDS